MCPVCVLFCVLTLLMMLAIFSSLARTGSNIGNLLVCGCEQPKHQIIEQISALSQSSWPWGPVHRASNIKRRLNEGSTTIPAVFQIETRSNIWDCYNPRKKLFISLVQFCLHCTVYTGCTLYIVQLLLLNKCYICGDSSSLSPKSSNLRMKNLTFSSLWVDRETRDATRCSPLVG